MKLLKPFEIQALLATLILNRILILEKFNMALHLDV